MNYLLWGMCGSVVGAGLVYTVIDAVQVTRDRLNKAQQNVERPSKPLCVRRGSPVQGTCVVQRPRTRPELRDPTSRYPAVSRVDRDRHSAGYSQTGVRWPASSESRP